MMATGTGTTKLNSSGFTLVVVLILSLAIMLLGATAMYLAAVNFKTTAADMKYNHAEKASNLGLLNIFDEINRTGTGGRSRSISGKLTNASYVAGVDYGGTNLWFLSSEGSLDKARVVKTAMFQGYHGAGLYTVRGTVNASLGFGSRLSGCDASVETDCFIPAFIASGTISTGPDERKSCTAGGAADGRSAGLFGAPAILNMDQGDLSRIFFKVDCFNKHANTDCNISLLDCLENDYGTNPIDQSKDFSFMQNDNKWGIPVVSIPELPSLPSGGSCVFPASVPPTSGLFLNLADHLTTCREIVLNSAASTITIRGDGNRNGVPVKIFTNGNSNQPKFDGASNFIFYTTKNDREVTVSNSSNFAIYSTNDVILKDTNHSFTLYTSGVTTLSGTVSGTAENPFRIVSVNKVATGAAGISLTNGSIVTGPVDVLTANDVAAPQNIEAQGNVTIENVNIVARSLRFAPKSTVRILDSLVYVYAYACPNCSRAAGDFSLNACRETDNRWCGWYGEGINLNIGRAADGVPKPVLFLSNNSTVRTVEPAGTAYIWGVWYGEDVTYLSWEKAPSQNLNGFVVRNFPPELTLEVTISGSGFSMNFSKPMMDSVADKYRFFRKVECVRDPLTPKAQLIQTQMTSY